MLDQVENSNRLPSSSLEEFPQCGDAGENVVLVYENLRKLAHTYLKPHQDSIIAPTVLVHEAYLKLRNVKDIGEASHTKYFAYGAKAMREILLNHYRKRATVRRGGNLRRTTFDDNSTLSINNREDVLGLDEALTKLEKIDPFRASIIEMRFFGGMTMAEIAEATGRSLSTVNKKWAATRIWLRAEMTELDSGAQNSARNSL